LSAVQWSSAVKRLSKSLYEQRPLLRSSVLNYILLGG
jgi:hypothetical protein